MLRLRRLCIMPVRTIVLITLPIITRNIPHATTLRTPPIRSNCATFSNGSAGQVAPSIRPQKKKSPDWEVGALFLFLLRRMETSFYFVLIATDSHRVRGVFSFVALLSPVESSITFLRSSRSSHPPFYTSGLPPARAFFKRGERRDISLQVCRLPCEFLMPAGSFAAAERFRRQHYLMNRLSRSWSRPTNDFIVRNLPNSSWISRFCSGFCAGRIAFAVSTWSVFVSITR